MANGTWQSRAGGLVLLLLALTGCGGQSATAPSSPAKNDAGQVPYVELPRLRMGATQALRQEMAEVQEAGHAPFQLLEAERRIPEDHDLVLALERALGGYEVENFLTRLDNLAEKLRGFSYPVDWRVLRDVTQFSRLHDPKREAMRNRLRTPQARFGRVHHEMSLRTNQRALDLANVYYRLERLHALECLAANDVAGAIETFDIMLRLTQRLAEVKDPLFRLMAARLRLDTLDVGQQILRHPGVAKLDLEKMNKPVVRVLQDWPDDALAWIGDRAQGLCIYEMIRDGKIYDILTYEEQERLRHEKLLEGLDERLYTTINADQLYYLETMRRIIADCDDPFHQRRDALRVLMKELASRIRSPGFPVVAGRMLLPEIESAQEMQARDRSACEAWALLLAHAAGLPVPSVEANPRTGEPYRVVRRDDPLGVWEEGIVMVADLGDEAEGDPFIVYARDFVGEPKEPDEVIHVP